MIAGVACNGGLKEETLERGLAAMRAYGNLLTLSIEADLQISALIPHNLGAAPFIFARAKKAFGRFPFFNGKRPKAFAINRAGPIFPGDRG